MWSRSRTVGSRSPDTAAVRASPALQESLREQTPVSLFGSESRGSVGSFIEATTEAVKEILLEHEAIASFIMKLKTKLNCKKASLDVVIPAADKVVEDMIPESLDECTYKSMASSISSGQHEAHSQQLGHIIYENLQRDLGDRKINQVTVQNEVDKFMNRMQNWLNQQTQKLAMKNNRVDDSLKRIRGALDLPELPEDTVTPVESAAPSITAESGVSGDEHICTTPVTEPRPPSVTDQPGDEDICTTPVTEPRPPTITDEPGVGDFVTPVCDRSPSIADEEDDYTPKFECVGARVTDKTAVKASTQPTENMYYKLMVTALVHECLKKTGISVSKDEINRVISTLTDMLRTGGVDFKSIQPTGHQMKKTAKAVHKDLCAVMGGKGVVVHNLLSEDSEAHEFVIEALKRQLAKPKKPSIKKFFISLFHTVSRPFERCPCSICD
ncbi:hypothetical protein GBF38_007504 [Nibea albiflora]|uniref:Uncharacterized protein n=1 Tax=Nibea albiflora TaxID=240163 RepID=A0ACB7ELN8_NIBAL|nr:hypothetical protein GBF38_007504 [Nibea albiflora]